MQAENQEVTTEQPSAPQAPVVATPIPETPAQEATQEAAQEPQTEDRPRDEKGQFKSPVQTRIDDLTRARREAEREAAYWKQRAEPAQSPSAPPAKPTVEQFKDYGEFVEALADWKADQKVSERLSARDADAAKSADQRVQETRNQTFAERQATVKTSIPDYEAVVGAADVAISPHLSEAILDSDKGPELVYHLAKNPAEAARLSALSPMAAARELGRIEATLEKPAKPVTKAPAPMKPTAGTGSSQTTDLSKMSTEEYIALRTKQGAKWAR